MKNILKFRSSRKAYFSCLLLFVFLFVYYDIYSNNGSNTVQNLLSNKELSTKLDKKCSHILKHVCTDKDLPKIYVVTPTYERTVQKAELTRISYCFLLVPNIHWIIVEDSAFKTNLVKNFIKRYKGEVTHLNVETPKQYKLDENEQTWRKPRGVLQRNLAIDWLIANAESGVVYFADDDNTYDVDLFEEMRYTNKVSVWPVGIVGGLIVETPLVTKGKVSGWNSVWNTKRAFPIDMAGFAINLRLFKKYPKVRFSNNLKIGYQETHLLNQLEIQTGDLEPKADNCKRVLVWHTRTEAPKLNMEKRLKYPSNSNIEV